jgi:hypothetical protein
LFRVKKQRIKTNEDEMERRLTDPLEPSDPMGPLASRAGKWLLYSTILYHQSEFFFQFRGKVLDTIKRMLSATCFAQNTYNMKNTNQQCLHLKSYLLMDSAAFNYSDASLTLSPQIFE